MGKRTLLSLLLAICMVISLAPMAAFAVDDAQVQIEVRNSQSGRTQYKVNAGDWIELNTSQVWDIDGVSDGDTVTICAVPNEGQALNTSGTEFRVNGYLEDINHTDLQKETGWSFTYSEGKSYQVCIEYRSGGNAPETHTVDFGTGSWTVGEQTVTADKTGTIDALAMDAEITLTGFDADTMQAQLVAEDGFIATLTVFDGKTSLSARNCEGLPDGTLQFSVAAKPTGGQEGGDPGPGDPVPGNSGELRFTCQSQAITGGSIFYKLNNTGDFIRVSEENDQYNAINLNGATALTVRIAANEGYQLDTTRGVAFRVNGSEAYFATGEYIAEFTSEAGYTFDLSDLVGDGSVSESIFELEFGFGDAGDDPGPGPGSEPGDPGPGPEDEPAHGGYEGEEKTASVTVTGQADFYINDSRMVNGNDSTHEVNYTYAGNNTVDFYFCWFINQRYTTLMVNGVDYYSYLPNPSTEEGKAALADACKGQINEFKVTVPYSESGYEVEASVKGLDETDADYMVVGNFFWTYEDENQGDDYLDHGRMELIGVRYNGRDYSPDELNNPGTALDWGEDNGTGNAVLPVGAVVTVKLVPEYGYQLTSFGINGSDFGTGDEQSTFTFEIKPGNAHLGAHFTPVEDKVTSTAQAVTEGSIALGSSGLPGGSAQLKISDADLSVDKQAEFSDATPSGYTVTDYLNLDLYNVYYKGSADADDVWEQEVNTLNEDATISVRLADSLLAGTVDTSNLVIIHNVHNGDAFETIPVDSYDPDTNTITFQTDSFSTYAIAIRETDVPHTHTLTLVPAKDSTCTEAGSKAYYTCDCGKWFEDAAGAVEITDHSSVVIPAKGHTASDWKSDADNHWKVCTVVGCGVVIEGSKAAHSYGDDNVCDVCGYTKPVPAPSYSFIEGENGKWTQSGGGTLTFRVNGDFSKFTGVKVDGTLIDAKNYTAVSGSTIVTLHEDYLATLSAGTHTLTVVYTDGACSTNFETRAAQAGTPTSPQTGDNSLIWIWIVLLVVSGTCVVEFLSHNRKNRMIN